MTSYLVTISAEDHFAGGPFDQLHTALSYGEEVSRRVQEKGGRWDGADVKVWEASMDGPISPTLETVIARFMDGLRIPL